MLKFYDLNEFPKTLITEEKNIIICSERKVVDNFVTIGITQFKLSTTFSEICPIQYEQKKLKSK